MSSPAAPEGVPAGGPSGSSDAGETPGCHDFASAPDAPRQRRFRSWTIAAALAYLAATAALRWQAALPVALPWLAVALAVLLALVATNSYLRFLREADELLRKIETGAVGLAFGVGLLLALLYPLAEGLGAPRLEGDLLGFVMMVSWATGSWLGRRRYGRTDA